MDKIPEPKILTLDPNDDNIILEIPEDRDPNTKEEPMKKEKVWKRKNLLLFLFGCTEVQKFLSGFSQEPYIGMS